MAASSSQVEGVASLTEIARVWKRARGGRERSGVPSMSGDGSEMSMRMVRRRASANVSRKWDARG